MGTVAVYTPSLELDKNVGDATVTITNGEGGNYIVSGSVTFEIRKGSAELSTYPQAKDLTYTGQPQELVTGGTATGGHIEYALDGVAYSKDIPKSGIAYVLVVAVADRVLAGRNDRRTVLDNNCGLLAEGSYQSEGYRVRHLYLRWKRTGAGYH